MSAVTTSTKTIDEIQAQSPHSGREGLYRLAAVGALGCVLVALADMTLTFLPMGAGEPGSMAAVDWFALFQHSWFLGMRNLGLLPNIPSQLLMIPLFLGLYGAHSGKNREYARAALVVFLLGSAVYLSNNAAFPMLALNARYSAATTEAQRAVIAAAGEAVLARGEDFTPGSLPGFILGELAILSMSLVMLRGAVFSKAAALMGVAGSVLLSIFTIWSTFIPANFEASMLIAMLGGLASIAWYILSSRDLFRLATHS